MRNALLPVLGVVLIPCLAAAQSPAPTAPAKAPRANDCRLVVGSEPGATPYKLCMTRADWEAKVKSDSKDANRLVCHYEEAMGTRFRSYKLCMPASAWDTRRMTDREAIERIQRNVCVSGAGC